MLNTHKLLYILPDVAFVAELLPGKKEHAFVVQAFRQINGEFLDEENFIVENIEKLVSKIEPEEYHVVLPDFLFTNTIIEVEDAGDAKIKNHLKDTVLPELEIKSDSHYFDTFVLTQHQGKAKVQLAALEKEAILPLSRAFASKGIHITGVTSLSWTIKSVVSLEPSITIVQAGASLYLAQHYIGVDQTNSAKVEEIETLAETIKTLKGAEPSIQTVYLLTNELVEEKLKQVVSSTLPIQQLASFKETENQMPSYVKQLIESGMKTLDIPEFNAPVFVLDAVDPASMPVSKPDEVTEVSDKTTPLASPNETATESVDHDEDEVEEVTPPIVTPVAPPTLPPPMQTAQTSLLLAHEVVSTQSVTHETVSSEDNSDEVELPKPSSQVPPTTHQSEKEPSEMSDTHDSETHHEPFMSHQAETHANVVDVTPTPPLVTKTESTEFVSTHSATTVPLTPDSSQTRPHQPLISPATKPQIIKNKTGVGGMLKTIGLMLGVFIITVGIGIGLGLGVLSLTQKTTTPEPSPSVVPSVAPSAQPSPSPVASTSAQVKPADTTVLVVNATTIAGHAGQTKRKLDEADYKKVVASNAKGEYKAGTYVLMAKEDKELIAALEKVTGLKLTFQADAKTEDPKGEYTAIIVLAE